MSGNCRSSWPNGWAGMPKNSSNDSVDLLLVSFLYFQYASYQNIQRQKVFIFHLFRSPSVDYDLFTIGLTMATTKKHFKRLTRFG